MDVIGLKIKNIKNIKEADIELPFETGLYGLVGINGCGKSTLLLTLAELISSHYLGTLNKGDFDKTSSVTYVVEGVENTIKPNDKDKWPYMNKTLFPRFNGMYEGSLFYGTRFENSAIIDNLVKSGRIKADDIVDADDYVIEKLSYILKGEKNHYKSLKRVRNKHITEKLGLSNTPYFIEVNDNLISQYRMSSGECLLISLLHFIYNALERRSLPADKKILVLIDEIELALHPSAVDRLLELFNELLKEHNNLIVILSSHSPEVIRKIEPSKLYKMSNDNGLVTIESKCYPSYLIRDLYSQNGFDFILLVEDDLARVIVEKVLFKNSDLTKRKLVNVVPVGGWENVLKLHRELLVNNVLGLNTKIYSILDGDVTTIPDELAYLPHLKLPVASVEKFIFKNVVENKNKSIYDLLSDKYFTVKSLSELVAEYHNRYDATTKHPDKKFYFKLRKDLEDRRISEEYFIANFAEDLFSHVNFNAFTDTLRRIF